MNFSLICASAALAFLAAQCSAEPAKQPLPDKKGHGQHQGCPENQEAGKADALDISNQADESFLNGAAASGIKLIMRYYDWKDDPTKPPPSARHYFNDNKSGFDIANGFTFNWREGPSWRGKTLTAPEIEMIHARNMLVGVVFQHLNSDIRTFQDPGRPAFDAHRALDLAKELNQPEATLIFFGADHQFTRAEYPAIENYFRIVSSIVTAANYKVGVYGDGYVCKNIKNAGLASHCWLSQSIGKDFLESIDYEKSNAWQIKQCAERRPYPGSETTMDPDILNMDIKDIGF